MTVKRGTEQGVCRDCKHHKNDLYGGYCGDCRTAYGRRTNGITAASKDWHSKNLLDRQEYSRREETGAAGTRSPAKPTAEKRVLEYKIAFIYLRRAVTDLLNELDKVGYSVPDTVKHYKNFGGLREPYNSLDRIRRLLEKQPSE